MFTHLSSYLSALLMALPMCWCCMVQAMPEAAEESACPHCHLEASKEAPPAGSCPASACCYDSHERTVSPDTAAAPRLVLMDLPVALWQLTENELPPQGRELDNLPAALLEEKPGQRHPPLYHQHCALLI
jgi:hypothetical protein